MAFTSTKVFRVSPNRIPDMARTLEIELRKDGYDTRNDMLLGGDVIVSVTKGGLFKSVIGMKTALKAELRAEDGNVFAKTSVGIWGQQIVPTVIMLLWFWPVLITQIWGLVQQSRLDTRVMEILAKAAEKKPGGGRRDVVRSRFSCPLLLRMRQANNRQLLRQLRHEGVVSSSKRMRP